MDLRRLSFAFLVQDTVVIPSHGFYSRLHDIFFILLSFLLCLENVKWGIIMKTGILRNVVRLLKYYLFFNRNRVLIAVLIPFNGPEFFILVAYAVIIFRVSEKIATIGTRFRFKIIIRYYSFSLIQFSISFSKNQYLLNWNRVLIAVSCLALT